MEHVVGEAGTAKKVLSLDRFHRCMHQQTLFLAYVTLCDTTDTMALWTKGTLLHITTGTFKYIVK